ncbi:MAG: hypothetical protein P8Y69_09990, partial [Gammaproteobacteria bacterium]
MTLEELLACAGATRRWSDAVALNDRMSKDGPEDWRNLAVLLALVCRDEPRKGRVLGIGGGQGAGKTTLATKLVESLSLVGLTAAALSIDDFYLTRAARQRLAHTVHPLLGTRGVPGTHDVMLAVSVIRALKSGEITTCPRFDKAVDDRAPEGSTLGPDLDVIIFEGWCVGVPPQPAAALDIPANDLERIEDPNGVWRRYVNDRLTEEYPALWALIDDLVYLQVPDMRAVLRWRTQQEAQHPPGRRMDPAALARFGAHYERLTRWMSEELSRTAQLVGFLDENHQLEDLRVAGNW